MAEQLSLMSVFAHPDDEQGVSGALIKYGRMGVNTTLICGTRGEVGEIAPETNATPETLGQVREQEMRCAAQVIGVKNLYLLDYRDSGMVGTPENQDPRALNQANLLQVAGQVIRVVRKQKPQVMTTFDSWGGYGHPDHLQIHRATLLAFFLAGNPDAYPEQFAEGLEPWTPLKLYFSAFARSRLTAYLEYMEAEGKEVPEFFKDFERRALPDEAITTRLDVAEFAKLKLQSLLCHATQLGPKTYFRQMPEDLWLSGAKTENFVLAEARTERPLDVETDLFEGID